MQPDPLVNPTAWVSTVESYSQKLSKTETPAQGILLRKVRAHGNFAEYVPLGLLFIIVLELMHAPILLLWLLGGTLTVARIVYAWGVIRTYGPSVSRAIGFLGTWFVYVVGASACVYYGFIGIFLG